MLKIWSRTLDLRGDETLELHRVVPYILTPGHLTPTRHHGHPLIPALYYTETLDPPSPLHCTTGEPGSNLHEAVHDDFYTFLVYNFVFVTSIIHPEFVFVTSIIHR